MAIVLSLFAESEMTGVRSSKPAPRSAVPAPSAVEFTPSPVEARERLGADWGYLLNPCVQCRYRDMCDDDYCAMLCHPIDMAHAPSKRGWSVFGID